MQALGQRFAFLTLLALLAPAQAGVFELPAPGESVVGEPSQVTARHEDTLSDIARRHNVGFEAIRKANPDVDTWLPGEGTVVRLPTRFILPDAPREGLVINVAEMRLYYYPKARPGEQRKVVSYPISVGRGDWQTPLVRTRVATKVKRPTWYPPKSIRAEHAAAGDPLPRKVPPGPDNPLGKFALMLDLPGYLIHGTNRPYGIGMRVTHGCLRLYPEDIATLVNTVPVGTPVRIVNQPYKAGWHNGALFLEVHPPETRGEGAARNHTPVVRALLAALDEGSHRDAHVNWRRVQDMARSETGMPVAVTQGEAEPPSKEARASPLASSSPSAPSSSP